MSWLSDIAGSHRLQLGVTAVVSGCLAASAVIGLQEARRRYNAHELKDSIPGLDQPHQIEKVSGPLPNLNDAD
jgi:tRNA threonylcarbamoyladenosine dehydratase